MKKAAAFVVHQFAYEQQPVNASFQELIQYMTSHSLKPEANQTIFSGRACTNLKLGDFLFSPEGSALPIRGIHAYGQWLDAVSAGMTCCISADKQDGAPEMEFFLLKQNGR